MSNGDGTQTLLVATLYDALGLGYECEILHDGAYKRVTGVTRRKWARFWVYDVTFADGAVWIAVEAGTAVVVRGTGE